MPPESNVESTLIWYKGNDEKNWKYWADEIDRFLEGQFAEDYFSGIFRADFLQIRRVQKARTDRRLWPEQGCLRLQQPSP